MNTTQALAEPQKMPSEIHSNSDTAKPSEDAAEFKQNDADSQFVKKAYLENGSDTATDSLPRETNRVNNAAAPVLSEDATCQTAKIDTLTDTPLIASSVLYKKIGDKWLIVADTDNGPVESWIIEHDGAITPKTLDQHGQISCIEPYQEGYRTGIIRRNPKTSDYTLRIDAYDKDGNVRPSELWNATTRNFSPDPGTRCLFISRREILVSGTRPRGKHAPNHGMFKIESRALTFFDETAAHSPNLIDIRKNGEKYDVRVQQVILNDENKRLWQQLVYRIQKDNALEIIAQADFLIPTDDHRYIQLGKDGCVLRNSGNHCPAQKFVIDKLTDITPICASNENEKCVLLQEKTAQWLARISSKDGHITYAPFPNGLQLLPVRHPVTGAWLGFNRDDLSPDTTDGLAWYTLDSKSCTWK